MACIKSTYMKTITVQKKSIHLPRKSVEVLNHLLMVNITYMQNKNQLNLGKCCEVRKVGVKRYPPAQVGNP